MRPRTAARKDGTHNEFVDLWIFLGGSWLDLYQLPRALDGLAGMYGIDQRVEIKDPNAARGRAQAMRLTEHEQREFDSWRGRKPVIWATLQDVHDLQRALLADSLRLSR